MKKSFGEVCSIFIYYKSNKPTILLEGGPPSACFAEMSGLRKHLGFWLVGFVAMVVVVVVFFLICNLRVRVLALCIFTAGMSRLREVKSMFGVHRLTHSRTRPGSRV